jgi:CubicO group peptidase (beta-lactamase class C family)
MEEGKISENDSISKFLPDIPTFGFDIQIHHLIHHTSGYKDIVFLLGFKEGAIFGVLWTLKDHLNLIKSQTGLNHKPGEKFFYTNTGYLLLASIVEKVSGKKFSQFVKENVFSKLNMTNTLIRDDVFQIIPNVANAYLKTENGYIKQMPYSIDRGSSDIYITHEDLLKYDINWYQNILGRNGQRLIEHLLRTRRLNNGEQGIYAYGLFINNVNGLRAIEHSGKYYFYII